MTKQLDSSSTAHVRWLFAGAMSPTPRGTLTRVSRHDFTERMLAAELKLTATVSDRLGAEEKRIFEVSCDGLAAFKLAGLVERVPLLRNLRDLSADLGSADPARRPSAEQAIAKIIELVDDGRLAADVRKALTPPAAKAASAPASAPAARGEGALDRIFAQVHDKEPSRASAASAVDSFVEVARQGDGTSGAEKYSLSSASARAARAAIEEAVYGTAADLLRTPELLRLEAAWRGLKLVIDETPRESGLEVMVLDTEVGALPSCLEAALSPDREEWPDAVFVLDAMADVDQVSSLAELSSSLNIPVLVTPPEELFATALHATGGRKPDELVKALGPAWLAFRGNELSRWVCWCGNRVVLFGEGQGSTKRVVLGSPAFAAAAMLTASYRDTGLFGRVFGPAGGIKAPAVHSVNGGHGEVMLPVERFAPASLQAELAAVGLLALGSPKNSDKVVASSWPTLSGSPDAIGFPAQIITGRVVRFALWVRDQIAPGTEEADIKTVFEQAAMVFLFPGINEGAFLDAKVVGGEGGSARAVHLDVTVRAALAGSSVQLGFDIPLNG